MKKTIFVLLTLALLGCDQAPKVTDAEVAAVKAADSRTGMVLETIDVDSYTYIRLDQQGQEVWLASSPIAVSKGDLIRFADEVTMVNFHSKTLDRTFPAILFVGGVESVEAGSATLTEGLTAAPDVTNLHNNMAAKSIEETGAVTVERLQGGKTIAEIFTEYEQIEGQEVSLRAKVTKFSANILGKNWITLQDGTATETDSKLVVTSLETVAVGDEVVVKGIVRTNIDIGAGYNYKVLLEEVGFSD